MRMGVLWGAGFLYSMGSWSWQKAKGIQDLSTK